MASATTVDKFVRKILQLWPPFRWDDRQEAEWIETLTMEISGFSDQVLERALSEMVRKRDDRRTPLPAECINACVEAKRWLDVENGQKVLPTINDRDLGTRHPEWADSRIRLADDLVCGRNGRAEVGREAAREGFWILQLHDFCRQEQRLPNDKEIANLKRKARDVDDTFAAFVPNGGWASDTALNAIQTVQGKRQQLCEMVNGKWVRPVA